MLRLSSRWSDSSSRCSAAYRPTGMLTRPKVMLPFQIDRAIRAPLATAGGKKQDACRKDGKIRQKNQARALHTASPMEIVHWLHQIFGGRAEPLFLGITYLGSSAVLWAVIILWYWLFDPRLARRLGVVLALSEVSNQLLKGAFGSSRPYDLDTDLSSDLARRTGGGHGFPSGHAQNNAAFWFSLGFCFRRRWVWVLAFFAVTAVALSRLVLGVHLPVDVV